LWRPLRVTTGMTRLSGKYGATQLLHSSSLLLQGVLGWLVGKADLLGGYVRSWCVCGTSMTCVPRGVLTLKVELVTPWRGMGGSRFSHFVCRELRDCTPRAVTTSQYSDAAKSGRETVQHSLMISGIPCQHSVHVNRTLGGSSFQFNNSNNNNAFFS